MGNIKTIFPGSGQIVKCDTITAGTEDIRTDNYNCIYNGTTQTVAIQFEGDTTTHNFVALPAGTFVPGRIVRVTSGNNILGLIIE